MRDDLPVFACKCTLLIALYIESQLKSLTGNLHIKIYKSTPVSYMSGNVQNQLLVLDYSYG